MGEKEGGRTQEVTWFLFLLLKAQNSLLEDGEGSVVWVVGQTA